jgi:hypothetical protein
MFIHFDSDKGAECDNCGTAGTIMHMSVLRVDQTVSLCIVCFGALAQAICHASKTLIPSPSPNGSQCRIGSWPHDSGCLGAPVHQHPEAAHIAVVPFLRLHFVAGCCWW